MGTISTDTWQLKAYKRCAQIEDVCPDTRNNVRGSFFLGGCKPKWTAWNQQDINAGLVVTILSTENLKFKRQRRHSCRYHSWHVEGQSWVKSACLLISDQISVQHDSYEASEQSKPWHLQQYMVPCITLLNLTITCTSNSASGMLSEVRQRKLMNSATNSGNGTKISHPVENQETNRSQTTRKLLGDAEIPA